MEKKKTTFYITEELRDLMYFLMEKEDLPKINFFRRAINMFLEGTQKIDSRILITKRSDPAYIKRDICEPFYMDLKQYHEIEQVAKEQNCKMAQVVFQALVDYCSTLAMNYDEIVVLEKE